MAMESARAELTQVKKSGKLSWMWINSKIMIVGVALLTVFYVSLRLYQQKYAWSMGLDSTSPEFKTYWMNLQYALWGFEMLLAGALWSYVWFTRPNDLNRLEPKEEMRRLGVDVAIIAVYVFAVFWAASFFAEQDAVWHQTVVRDTSFTPNHIVLFYTTFPVYIILGVTAYLYARTRLPRFAARHSIPFVIAVAGPFMLLPVVGYNEWMHSYVILEERFTAPVHYWFTIFAWTGFGLGGLLLQICDYIYELTTGKAQTYDKSGPVSDPALDFENDVPKVA